MAKRRSNHEGSIFKRRNETWRAQITINGRRLSYSGKSQNDCRLWLLEMQKKIDSGLAYEASKISVEEFFSNWLISNKVNLRPKTWSHYQQVIRDYVLPDLGNIKLINLKSHQIQMVYDKLVGKGTGLRTVQVVHSVIHRALEHAIKLGLLGVNPDDATMPPKPRRREMMIWDENQVQTFLLAAKARSNRYLALYHLAITTGMRQGEILGLKWQDIDWDRKIIHIRRQLRRVPGEGFEFSTPKTKTSIRKVAIGNSTIESLREHQQRQYFEMQQAGGKWQDHGLVFPTKIGTPEHWRNFYRRYKKLVNEIGLPNIRFHDLRHTAASLMLNNGVPILIVSQRLGHAKPSTTLDIYGHLIPSLQKQAADMMDDIVTPISFETAPNCTKTAPRTIYTPK